jgi:hypothetical protein
MRLEPAEQQAFHERGFVLKRGVVGPERLEALRQELEALPERLAAEPDPARNLGVRVAWEPGYGPEAEAPRLRQVLGSDRVSEVLDAISREDALLGLLEPLLGPDLYMFASKLALKPAKVGTFTPWHQDWSYWRRGAQAPTQLNAVLAVDAADEANGAMRFVEGSHEEGPVPHVHLKGAAFDIGLEKEMETTQATTVAMEPGDVLLYGPLVIHGSGPNRARRSRRLNTFSFDKPGNRVKGEDDPKRLRRGTRA